MKRIVIGILSAVTAGTAALTLAAAPADAAQTPYPPQQAQLKKVDYGYGRDYREREREQHERMERLRRERMRREWLLRHGYLRDRF